MTYLSGDTPIIITTKDRDFKIGDVIASDDYNIYEIISLDKICRLSNIAKDRDFLLVNYDELSNRSASLSNSLNLSFKYEKVSKIINTKW